MSFSRGETSKSRLDIDWATTFATPAQNPDKAEAALRFLAQDADGKPILIQRTGKTTDKKVSKLLSQALQSERFKLASKWFHCVKVGDEVLDKKHYLHAVFAGKNPPRLVISTATGKKQKDFLGTASQKVKWKAIHATLAASYKQNPTKAVKEMESLLCEFDAIDSKRTALNGQLDRAREGKKTARIKKIEKQLAAQDKAMEQALAKEKKLLDLALRAAKKKADDSRG